MELPSDLIRKILVRLRLKDILNYKCVCREWYMLISNPNFTTYYAKHSPFTTIFLTQDHYSTKSLFLLEFSPNGDFIQMRINPIVLQSRAGINAYPLVAILGSCDGSLFLLHRRGSDHGTIDKVYLCNPLFDQSCVKVVEDTLGVYQPWHVLNYNFGYIPSTNNYKLLRFLHDFNRDREEAWILTVGVDKDWRILDKYFRCEKGVCFNGVCHWVEKGHNLDDICTFDLLEEKCGAIPKPPGLLRFSSENVKLTIVNDRLSVVDYSDCSQMNIWTMDKYGVAESWFINIILLKSWFPSFKNLYSEGFLPIERFLPIAVLPNGNIIFCEMDSGRIYFFSLGEKQCSRIKLRGVDDQVPIIMANAFGPRFYSVEGMNLKDNN